MHDITKYRICLGGATGWAGSALAKAIWYADDLELVSGISGSQAGLDLGMVLENKKWGVQVFKDHTHAFELRCDIYFDHTKPEAAKQNSLLAIEAGLHVVIGTSGLTERDFHELGQKANDANVAVLAVGNFAITAVLLQKFSEMAARYLDQGEIIDYASSHKIDAPSGTARELAYRLGAIRDARLDIPTDKLKGPAERREMSLNGQQVHSVRLPGYVIGVEALFGSHDQRLSIRHDAGSSALPYIDGALLAIRNIHKLKGLHRGLDAVMDW